MLLNGCLTLIYKAVILSSDFQNFHWLLIHYDIIDSFALLLPGLMSDQSLNNSILDYKFIHKIDIISTFSCIRFFQGYNFSLMICELGNLTKLLTLGH